MTPRATVDHRPLGRRALWIGLAALFLAALVVIFGKTAILPPYLVAVLSWGAIPIGSLAILMTYHLLPSEWGLVIGDALEAACQTLPLIALLFLPVLLFPSALYPWAQPGALTEPKLAAKTFYLNTPFFAIRSVVYFAIWIGLVVLLTRDNRSSPEWARRPRIAATGLIAYTLAATFAGIDWGMSLDPKFASSAYGWIFITNIILAAFAFAIVAVPLSQGGFGRSNPFVGAGETGVLSGLLLGGIVFWIYIIFMQYLVVWSANLPSEAAWYLERAEGGWGPTIWAIGILHGAVPFFILLSSRARQSGWVLTGLAALILILRFVHTMWLILPTFGAQGVTGVVLALLMIVGVGGLWVAAFLWALGRAEERFAAHRERLRHGQG